MSILNKASFDDKQLRSNITVPQFLTEGKKEIYLGSPDSVFWIKRISWQFRYKPVGPNSRTDMPVEPIQVTIPGILSKETIPYPSFSQPKPIRERIPIEIFNTNVGNNCHLIVDLSFDGVLVTPRENQPMLDLKTQMGYIQMDSTARGKMTLEDVQDEAMVDFLQEQGLGELSQIPGGVKAFNSLPPVVQALTLKNMVRQGQINESLAEDISLALALPGSQNRAPENIPLALPAADPDREESMLFGDLVSICEVDKDTLKTIAKAMVERGWRRV